MIAIAKTDSLYFSSMILKAMQLIGWCDCEKLIVSAMGAALYLLSRDHRDHREDIVIVAKLYQSHGDDRDCRKKIAIAAMITRNFERVSRSQPHCTYRGVVIAIM